MRKERWGLLVCSCEGELRPDAERLSKIAPLVAVTGHPREGAAGFAQQAREEGVTRVMVGCCLGAEPYEEAFREAGTYAQIHHLDSKRLCYLPHEDAGQANEKAARMLRGAMLAADRAGDVLENPLEVGGRIVVVTDHPDGLAVAKRLGKVGAVALVVEGPPGSLEGAPAKNVNWARLTGVSGRLGALTAALAPFPVNGGEPPEKILQSDQVVVVREGPPPELRKRTGVYLLRAPLEVELDELASQVSGLIGSFLKPEHIAYDKNICAGGSAQHETCGRCIQFCPYEAISRDPANPLRMLFDHFACEGCGACTSACPTGAAAFTDPNPAQIYNRMAGMLSEFGAGAASPPAPVVAFHCPEQGAAALELTAPEFAVPESAERQHMTYDYMTSGDLTYNAGILPVEVPCLRFVSMPLMMGAFRMGAAGVALLGCEDCPHGERELLLGELDLAGRILDAFKMGRGRVRLITGNPDTLAEAMVALDTFAGGIEPGPVRYQGRSYHTGTTRENLADSLGALIEATGEQPGGLAMKGGEPFALPDVQEEGCTLCRSCVNVCPSHAFRFDEEKQTLSLKHIECVACGLCETVCPETVISLRSELYLESEALEWRVLVKDDVVRCARCDKPYVNKKALETVEGRVLDLSSLLDTFHGNRRKLLRMCPDCRAADAIFEVERGWEP
ncbi:MAG: 4Fe-4S dicluster domain-containing protein [bacterium]